MKHFFLFLCTFLLPFAARAGTETATRRYDVSQLELKAETAPDGKTFTRVNWEGLELTSTPGAPELPVEYIRFIVPTFVKVTGVNVRSKLLLSQKLDYSIYPAQEPVSANHEGPVEFTAPDPQAYNTTYPIRAEYVEDGFIDGCNHIVTVAVYPFCYNPVDDTYSGVSSLTVTLDYEECDMAQLNATPIFPPHQSKYLDLTSMVENPDRLTSPAYVPRRKATADTPEYYYIITPRALADAFEDLAVWKRQKGYNVVVKCIEDVYEDEDFRIGNKFRLNADAPEEEVLDSAMSLRCYLKREFQDQGHFFCLLAGDWRTPMPIRKATSENVVKYIYERDEKGNILKDEHGNYIVKDTIYVTDNCEQAIPTDIYFTNLTKNYTLTSRPGMSVLSIVSSAIDPNPSISIGRLLCATNNEIENYIHKLIVYEAAPGRGKSDYLGNALFFEQTNYEIKTNNGQLLIDENGDYIYEESKTLIGDSKTVRQELDFLNITLCQDGAHIYHKNHNPCSTMDPDAEPVYSENEPTSFQIIEGMKNTGFYSWHGHGNPHGIGFGFGNRNLYGHSSYTGQFPYDYLPKVENSGINNIANKDMPAVLYSTSCDLAPFDYLEEYWESRGGMVYHLLPNVGRQFTTESAFYGGPAALVNTRESWIGSGSKLEKIFIENLKKYHKIGLAESMSKAGYTLIYEKMINHLIGEPEFEMWKGKPAALQINLTADTKDIKVEGELPSRINLVLYRKGNVRQIYDFSEAGSIPNPYPAGEFCASVWCTGYLPFIRLFSPGGSLSEERHYIVRDAMLGVREQDNKNTYTISKGGILKINAIDSVSILNGVVVEEGGILEITCRGDVDLVGCKIMPGGRLTVNAKQVKFGSGFKVYKGGIFKTTIR